MPHEMMIFVKVVQEGGFSAAARALNVPKSTVSRRVAQLEDRLGVQLLHRTTRTIRLTDVGASYYERCARIVAEIEETEAAVTRMQARPSGTLRISAPLTFGFLFLGEIFAGFLKRYPEVQLDVVMTDRKVDIISEGFDMAFRIGTLQDSSYVARRIGPARLTICASPEYLAAHGRPETPEDLKRHACLRYGHWSNASAWTLAGGRSIQVDGPMTANNGDILRRAALAGLAIGMLPRFLVGPDLRAGRLVEILPEWPPKIGGIYMMYPPNRHLSVKVRALVDFVVETLGDEPPWERCDEVDAPAPGPA